jgi:hypothetical protein
MARAKSAAAPQCPESIRQAIVTVNVGVARGMGIALYTFRKALAEGQNSLRDQFARQALPFLRQPPLKRANDGIHDAFPSYFTELRSQLVCPWVLKIKTHWNSSHYY